MGYWDTLRTQRLNRRRALLAGATVGLGAVAVACGGGGGGGSGGSSESGDRSGMISKPVNTTKEAQPGGTYAIARNADITHFDSLAATDFQSASFGAFTYSKLLRYKVGTFDKPADGSVDADAAESWELTGDAMQVTFKLRPNLLFDPRPPTNSRPLDAEDVVFSWNKFSTRSNARGDMAHSVSPSAPIESVTAPDNKTVVVKLAFPFVPILGNLAFIRYLLINPRESDGGYDPRKDMRGSGAWQMTKYEPSVGWEFKKNPDWYDKPRPFLDNISYSIIPEYATGLAQFKAGNLWSYGVRQEDIIPTKKDQPNMIMLKADSWSRANGTFMYFSYKPGSPFLDERVRQAASMLIDRDLFIDTFANVSKFRQEGIDVQTRWHSHISSGEEKYWLDPKGKDLGEGAKNFQYNPSEATKLMRAAGYSSTLELPFTYFNSVYGPTWPNQMNVLKGMLETGNLFKFTYNIVDYQTVWLPQYLYGYGLADGIWFDLTTTFPDIDGHLYAHYHPNGQYVRFPFKDGSFKDDKLVSLVENQRKETDPNKRTDLLKEFQRYLAVKMYDVQVNGQALGLALTWPWVGNAGVYNTWGGEGAPQETTPFLWYDKSKKSG